MLSAAPANAPPVEWKISPGLVPYEDAVRAMEARVAAIRDGSAAEQVWLLEHPPLYTAGTSARATELLDPDRLPVHRTGRGGQYTYHGPGQRIAYVMLDLKRRGPDLRAFVGDLERWIIDTLADFDVIAGRREGRVGVWVARTASGGRSGPWDRTGNNAAGHIDDKVEGKVDDKIAAIGVRVRRWVTFHGVAVNLDPDLDHYQGIVPCGISDHGVTSLVELGRAVTMADLDVVLRTRFEHTFGVKTIPG